MPLSDGILEKKPLNASSPPAEAPIPTIGQGSRGWVRSRCAGGFPTLPVFEVVARLLVVSRRVGLSLGLAARAMRANLGARGTTFVGGSGCLTLEWIVEISAGQKPISRRKGLQARGTVRPDASGGSRWKDRRCVGLWLGLAPVLVDRAEGLEMVLGSPFFCLTGSRSGDERACGKGGPAGMGIMVCG